jgi:hypothetical protein
MQSRSYRTDRRNCYLTRVDYPSVRGWVVRFPTPGGRVAKLFSDSKYGGDRKARAAAQRFRDQLAEKYGWPASANPLPRKQCRRNTSGKVGVSRYVLGGRWYGWQAFWNDPPGRQNRRRFLFSEYGRAAQAEAIAFRLHQEERIKRGRGGRTHPPHPTGPPEATGKKQRPRKGK